MFINLTASLFCYSISLLVFFLSLKCSHLASFLSFFVFLFNSWVVLLVLVGFMYPCWFLHSLEPNRFYHYTSCFDKFSNKGSDLVLQFSLKMEDKLDCGGKESTEEREEQRNTHTYTKKVTVAGRKTKKGGRCHYF